MISPKSLFFEQLTLAVVIGVSYAYVFSVMAKASGPVHSICQKDKIWRLKSAAKKKSPSLPQNS